MTMLYLNVRRLDTSGLVKLRAINIYSWKKGKKISINSLIVYVKKLNK